MRHRATGPLSFDAVLIREFSSGLPFKSGFAQFLHVGKILMPSHGELVLNQVLAGDDVRRNVAINETPYSVLPGFIKGHAVDLPHDIDSRGRLADQEDRIVREICRSQAAEMRPVLGECAKYCLDVLFIRADEEVQAFGRSRFSMNAERVGTNDKILNPVCVERA